jgi:hypothetical protein
MPRTAITARNSSSVNALGQAMIRAEISEYAQADLNDGFLFYEA